MPRRRLDEAGDHQVRTEFGDLVLLGAEPLGDVLGAAAGVEGEQGEHGHVGVREREGPLPPTHAPS